jgi:imidazolonepropionase-like amidohydrolase
MPLVVQANRAAEIRGLLKATAGYDRLRLILAGGAEAGFFATELAERRIPVLVWPALRGRGAPDEYEGAGLSLAGELARAGVQVLIGSGGLDAGASRDLPLIAQLAVGGGLDRALAFEALTLGAARAFDLDRRLGSVERGKDAELLILDGEPLATATRVRCVISEGRVVVSPEE